MAQVAQISTYRNNTANAVAVDLEAPAAPAPAKKRNLTAVPAETEARGFALYFGIDEATAQAAGTSLTQIAAALKQTFAELVPQAADQTYAAVALAPKSAKGRNIDIVRAALQDPRALGTAPAETEAGLTIDLARKRIYLNGEVTDATNKEFDLLAHLLENRDRIVSRQELVEAIWHGDESEAPNERTIDVHVRRLRAKIAGFEDVIRTIRGVGYQYNENPDVLVTE
jgi:hypothetical protein